MPTTYTAHLGLAKFGDGDTGWGDAADANFDLIDTAITALGGSNLTTVTFSATPTLSSTASSIIVTLTGNVTSSTLAAGSNGQPMTVFIVQDSTGSRTWVWPSNVRGGGVPSPLANLISVQSFTYITALSAWVSNSVMYTGV